MYPDVLTLTLSVAGLQGLSEHGELWLCGCVQGAWVEEEIPCPYWPLLCLEGKSPEPVTTSVTTPVIQSVLYITYVGYTFEFCSNLLK